MICSVMSGPVMKDVSYHHEYGPQQAVVYNDESYSITLSADELSNYTWVNLATLINDEFTSSNFSTTSMSYNDSTLSLDSYEEYEYFTYDDGDNRVRFFVESSNENYSKFMLYYWPEDPNEDAVSTNFQYSVIWNVGASNYAVIKSAIQADIQANQTSSMPSIQDLFAQVTAAINAFIGSLGDAFTQVTALFWDSTASTPGPTFLGLLVLIGVGVGLVYAAYRVIKGLLHRI